MGAFPCSTRAATVVVGGDRVPKRDGSTTARERRTLATVQVERCWSCLEQPADTTVELQDGRRYPVCDICAEQYPPGRLQRVTDDQWAQIVADLR